MNTGKDYNPFRTAMKRSTLSRPMRELNNRGLLQGKILDYACGHGDDVKFLQEQGMDIQGYDHFNPVWNDWSLLLEKYDVLTCNYMFNVIQRPENHEAILEIFERLADVIYISVRSDTKAIKPNWIYSPEDDGYWTGRGTFQRFYDEEKIKKYFGDVEYIINDSSTKLFKLKR